MLEKTERWCPTALALCQQHWAGPGPPQRTLGSSGPAASAEVTPSSRLSSGRDAHGKTLHRMDFCIRAEEEVSILPVHDDKVLLTGKGRLGGASSWSTLNGPGVTQYISVSPKPLDRSPAIIPPAQIRTIR